MKPLIILTFSAFVLSCCNDDDGQPAEKLVFSICPVDTSAIGEASPLGNINPPGHTLPSDHIGFYLKGDAPVPVYSMAGGTIRSVFYNEWSDDNRIEINHSEQYMFYLDHISNLPSTVVTGKKLETGDLLGYALPEHGAFDIGLMNKKINHHFIIPERYHELTLYHDDPYLYFTDSIRAILEVKNPRIGEPKGGKVDYDIDGTLSGNWFLEGTPLVWEAASFLYGENQLAFVYNMYNASTVMISCGGTLQGAPFAYSVNGNGPDPASVTMNSGIIVYALNSYTKNSTMLVEMLEDRKIRVQVFDFRDTSEVSSFTNARIYVR